ncbi:basic-leucine zipper transcription factor [Cavenderia fasciculata]|uniref:Basic-leucine zipper transcription factor n=1 Tax=Cavenderia fasciculata TaxID=261658 RepID=F4PW29_CACFS|nr:basic-leucine zipper transcription factor [Cavenderia fasciculata]EGG20193.1 basic-leucine zipper transcription factor [Cavenderia fasciculata]|eukprot:XP_004367176.1 basic-leucine zipper transcription factor [Cavenderia fasciculata]
MYSSSGSSSPSHHYGGYGHHNIPSSPSMDSMIFSVGSKEHGGDDKVKKRQVRLLKNRQSAALSRTRKKEYIVNLEEKGQELQLSTLTLKKSISFLTRCNQETLSDIQFLEKELSSLLTENEILKSKLNQRHNNNHHLPTPSFLSVSNPNLNSPSNYLARARSASSTSNLQQLQQQQQQQQKNNNNNNNPSTSSSLSRKPPLPNSIPMIPEESKCWCLASGVPNHQHQHTNPSSTLSPTNRKNLLGYYHLSNSNQPNPNLSTSPPSTNTSTISTTTTTSSPMALDKLIS